jgi:4-hydroxyproline epimerase
MQRVHIIDSHTEGEPTRLVIEGGPDLGAGPLAERREMFRGEFDWFRSAVVNEPRGADHLVGALLCEPHNTSCAAGVIFFNNAGYLQMCGHGTIGLVATLAYLGRIQPGEHRIETPVGVVTAKLHDANRVTIANVPSYRYRKAVPVEVPGIGSITGDIAWGGNWFFLISEHGQELSVARLRELSDFTIRIKDALAQSGITGEGGAEIDHVELFGPPLHAGSNSRNFVMCPGGAYDRSPCGTGTSAKLACLYADGKLQPGQVWRQESILGTWFEGQVQPVPGSEIGAVLPTITGTAFVTSDSQLILDPRDPLRNGVRI